MQFSNYALFHIIGTIVAGLLFFHLMFRVGIAGSLIRKMIGFLVLSGFAGAVAGGFFPSLLAGRVAWGGLSSIGLLLATGASAWVFSRRYSLGFGEIVDRGAVAGILWLGIGRIGCAMAGCCYGRPMTGVMGFSLPDVAGHICSRYPAQILSATFDLCIFGVFFFRLQKNRHKPGEIFWLVSGAFALKRFVIGFMRGDLQPFLGTMSADQVLAVPALILAIWMLGRLRLR